MIEETRFYDPNEQIGDEKEFSLRPKTLADFIGQANLRRNLSVFIEAAKKEMNLLSMFFFMALLDWGRPPWLIL